MTEVEKMRSSQLADMSAPELQVRFEHAKKLLARMRGMSTYDEGYRELLDKLVPGIPEMWLFGTQIWILFLIVAVRHYLNYRKGGRGRDASGDKAPEHPMEPSEEGETSVSSTKTEE